MISVTRATLGSVISITSHVKRNELLLDVLYKKPGWKSMKKVSEFFRTPLVISIKWGMVDHRPRFGPKGGYDQVINGTAHE